jgi:hypothetical protein
LVKNIIERELLIRSMRYAIERQQLWLEVGKLRQKEAENKELSRLMQFSKRSPTNSTAESFGLYPLRESSPDSFAAFVDEYSKILNYL